MVLTLEEARQYARDMESSDLMMQGYIDAAWGYVVNAIGPAVPEGDPLVKLLAGQVVAEMDGVHGITSAEEHSRRFLVQSLVTQLQAKYGHLPVVDL